MNLYARPRQTQTAESKSHTESECTTFAQETYHLNNNMGACIELERWFTVGEPDTHLIRFTPAVRDNNSDAVISPTQIPSLIGNLIRSNDQNLWIPGGRAFPDDDL